MPTSLKGSSAFERKRKLLMYDVGIQRARISRISRCSRQNEMATVVRIRSRPSETPMPTPILMFQLAFDLESSEEASEDVEVAPKFNVVDGRIEVEGLYKMLGLVGMLDPPDEDELLETEISPDPGTWVGPGLLPLLVGIGWEVAKSLIVDVLKSEIVVKIVIDDGGNVFPRSELLGS